ncbi:hypothetical protein ACTXT7_004976 [Hymenolepis weldensis]
MAIGERSTGAKTSRMYLVRLCQDLEIYRYIDTDDFPDNNLRQKTPTKIIQSELRYLKSRFKD